MANREKAIAAWVSDTKPMLLRGAIELSGLSARAFAGLLEVDERTIRRWIAGEREVPGPVMVIAKAIIRDPSVVASLAPP